MEMENIAVSSTSKVELVKDITTRGETRYGVSYFIGEDKVSDSDLQKVNKALDTIVFCEHCKGIIGRYPRYRTLAVTTKGRQHDVFFDGCTIDTAKRSATMIAKLLGIKVNCEFLNIWS